MPTIVCTPSLDAPPPPGPFVQSLSLSEGKGEIARALWCVAEDPTVVQIIALHVAPDHRRQGSAGQIYDELIRQAKRLNAHRQTRLRRVWILIEQKSQILGRSFLTGKGFHHTTTVTDLLHKQDGLIYQKGYD